MPRPTAAIDAYLNGLPEDRKYAMSTLRQLIIDNLPAGYEEGMQYGMISYYVPLADYPNTYNGQPLSYVALASQKNYMSLYLMGLFDEEESFRTRYKKSGKRLDMGKSCVRFRTINDLPLELVAETVKAYTPQAYIARYEKAHKG